MLGHPAVKYLNHSGLKTKILEDVFFEVWQFKYKSFMSYIWLEKKIHDPEFLFAIISVWKAGKDGTGKEADSILRPLHPHILVGKEISKAEYEWDIKSNNILSKLGGFSITYINMYYVRILFLIFSSWLNLSQFFWLSSWKRRGEGFGKVSPPPQSHFLPWPWLPPPQQ